MRLTFFVFLLVVSVSLYGKTTKAPNVRVLTFDELSPHLNQKNDTVYLVNFWATWCAPCVAELPAIGEVEKKYAGKKFKVLLVSLDMPGQLNNRLIPFIEARKIRSEVVLLNDPNQNRWIDLVDKNWSGEIPFTVIYSKNFRETYSKTFTFNALDSIINRKIKLP